MQYQNIPVFARFQWLNHPGVVDIIARLFKPPVIERRFARKKHVFHLGEERTMGLGNFEANCYIASIYGALGVRCSLLYIRQAPKIADLTEAVKLLSLN